MKFLLLISFAFLNSIFLFSQQNTESTIPINTIENNISSSQYPDFNFNVNIYNRDDGLSHRDVNCIFQDTIGFMWFGTKYGLNRFDGYKFKWFTKENNGLPSNEIKRIIEDRNGLMWLFDYEGKGNLKIKSIGIFNPYRHKVQSIQEKFGDSLPFKVTDIIGFSVNDTGKIILISKLNKLIIYDIAWKIINIDIEDIKNLDKVQWGTKNLIWITTHNNKNNNSIYAIDLKGNTLKYINSSDCLYSNIYQFHENGDVDYFEVGKKNGDTSIKYFHIDSTLTNINEVKKNQFKDVNIFLKKSNYFGFVKSKGSWMWIVTDNNFTLVFDKISGKIIDTLSNKYKELQFTTDIYFDKNDNIWFSTQFGIVQLKIHKQLFKNYLTNQVNNTDDIFSCRNIIKDKNDKIWVRTENPRNIFRIDRDKDMEWDMSVNNGDLPALPEANSFGHALIQTRDSFIWYTSTKGIVKFNSKTNIYQEIDLYNKPTNIWALYEDKYGKVWFQDQGNNAFCFILNNKINILPIKLDEIKHLYVYQFLETSKKNKVFLVTDNGLFVLDTKENKIINHYWSEGKGNEFFPYDIIHNVYKDLDNTYWFATQYNGFVQVSFTNNKFNILNRFSNDKGFLSNTFYAIYPDNYNNLWISSDYGICRFNKESQSFRTYTEKDGLSNNEFNRVSHFMDNDGNIYFGSVNGLTIFNPKDFLKDSFSFSGKMAISEFLQVDSKKHDKLESLRSTNKIIVHPSDRYFRLEFELLNYNNSRNQYFAYKIDGLDSKWNYQKENNIQMGNLPYGKYLLRIKGQGDNGQWSSDELAIDLIVLKPFYLKTWFLIVCGFIFLSFGPIIYIRRVYKMKIRHKELETTVARKTAQVVKDKNIIEKYAGELKKLDIRKSQFFNNVSHELRTPLTLMLGPVNTLIKKDNCLDENRILLNLIKSGANKLLELTNEILDLSKLEFGNMKVNEKPVHFTSFVETIVAQFHSYAESLKVDLSANFEIDKNLYLLLDKNKTEKIITNFISNSLKHTAPGGVIRICIKDQSGIIELSVKDNGIGIHPNDLNHIFDRFYQAKHDDNNCGEGGTGIGLSLCKELSELLGGNVWAESILGQGSTFYFSFPKKQLSTSVKTNELESKNIQIESTDLHIERIINKNKITILFVEDNSDLRKYIKLILPDYNIITAENGKIALDILYNISENKQENKLLKKLPDLIISDLMMPLMNGFDLLERVKSENSFRHIPFIMLTANINVKPKLKALRIGVDDYLTKPFQEEELEARIQNLLRNQKERIFQYYKREVKFEENKIIMQPVISEAEAEWLKDAEKIFSKYISDNSFKTDIVANKLHISPRQFNRRIKRITGLSSGQFMQEIRLQAAREYLIQKKYYTIKETASSVGYKDTKYFSEIFKRRFGLLPSQYFK